ncbi:hypothetical protein [Leisingera sp. JC11]|uniref:hypothetical protein n=1 Tax=Leisingera sp. JC11 TaxID=3042469 RepID=UPI0034550BB7
MLGLGFSATGAALQGPGSRPAGAGLIGWYSAKATGTITRGAGEEATAVANLVPGGASLSKLSGGGPAYAASEPLAGGRPALVWPDAANASGLALAADALVREVFAVMAYADGARGAFDTYNTLITDLAGLDSSSVNRVMGQEGNAGVFTSSLPPGMTIHLNGGGATTTLLPMPLSVVHIRSATPFALAAIGGRNNGSSRAWRGPVCEVLAYSDTLDAGAAGSNVSYLKDGWGIG